MAPPHITGGRAERKARQYVWFDAREGELLTGSGAGRVDTIRDPVGSKLSVLARDVKKEGQNSLDGEVTRSSPVVGVSSVRLVPLSSSLLVPTVVSADALSAVGLLVVLAEVAVAARVGLLARRSKRMGETLLEARDREEIARLTAPTPAMSPTLRCLTSEPTRRTSPTICEEDEAEVRQGSKRVEGAGGTMHLVADDLRVLDLTPTSRGSVQVLRGMTGEQMGVSRASSGRRIA